MYIPRDFGDPEQNFWNLVNDAILCDVGVERQVEITGPDAAKFVQMLTSRDLSKMAVGQCKYILITDAEGGLLNDPILLRLAENHFWISLADSDILLWAKGVAVHAGMDVTINEPDVSPLQLQGPKSGKIMQALFGESILDLKYYWLRELELDGIPLLISRTGWSSELGYEIYLRDESRGDELWEKIMAVGAPLGLKPGHTSSIRRIEGGMLSYHADADYKTNPFELGLDRLVNLEIEADFIGKAALRRIKEQGVSRKQVGLVIEGTPLVGQIPRIGRSARTA
jgi:glycine cleavage system aminomethyltransferase T